MATGCQYGTFAGKEVVDFTRKFFGLSDKREDTLIGGLSMGGFGALHTGLAYPETFGGIHDWTFWNKYIMNGLDWVLEQVK